MPENYSIGVNDKAIHKEVVAGIKKLYKEELGEKGEQVDYNLRDKFTEAKYVLGKDKRGNERVVSAISFIAHAPEAVEIVYLATKNNLRRKGIGSTLVYSLMDDNSFMFPKTLFLRAYKAAVGFYRNLGFLTLREVRRHSFEHLLPNKKYYAKTASTVTFMVYHPTMALHHIVSQKLNNLTRVHHNLTETRKAVAQLMPYVDKYDLTREEKAH